MPNLNDTALRRALVNMLSRKGGQARMESMMTNRMVRDDAANIHVIRRELAKGRFYKRGGLGSPKGAKGNQLRALRYLFTKLMRTPGGGAGLPPRAEKAVDRFMQMPRGKKGTTLDEIFEEVITQSGDDLSENETTREVARVMSSKAWKPVYGTHTPPPPSEMRGLLQMLEQALRN